MKALVAFISCALLYDSECKDLTSGCATNYILSKQVAQIHFYIPEGEHLEDDPDLFIHIRKEDTKADILRCEREHTSSNIACVVLDSRFQSEGLNGHNLTLFIQNATHALEGVYLLRIVFNGDFLPSQRCNLTLSGNADIKQEGEPDQSDLMYVWVFVPLVLILLSTIPIGLRVFKRKRRPPKRGEEAMIPDYIDGAPTDPTYQTRGDFFGLVLVGTTGAGKTSTGNIILGEDLFKMEDSIFSTDLKLEKKRSKRSDTEIEILDTTGLFDTHITQEDICLNFVQAVASMLMGPHAYLYVVRIGRYTVDEYYAYTRLKSLFHGLSKYMIVLFTHGDSLESHGKSIEDVLNEDNVPKELKYVLRDCSNRYIVFNNMARDPHAQVERLLSMVRVMVDQNGGKSYSYPKYDKIDHGMQ